MPRVSGSERVRQRGPRRGSTPTFSVVIISSGERDSIARCMDRLAEPCQRFGAEIVIMVPGSDADVAALRKAHPSARVVGAPADLRPDELRSMGLMEAGGDIVAFTDERADTGEEWLGVLERRSRNEGGYGPVPNGKIDWARYLQEHGLLLSNGSSK